jgi:hypothetical protein
MVIIKSSSLATILILMKLSKTLLSALLTGITLQAFESCTKKLDTPPKKTEQQEKNKQPENPETNLNCPACGMG